MKIHWILLTLVLLVVLALPVAAGPPDTNIREQVVEPLTDDPCNPDSTQEYDVLVKRHMMIKESQRPNGTGFVLMHVNWTEYWPTGTVVRAVYHEMVNGDTQDFFGATFCDYSDADHCLERIVNNVVAQCADGRVLTEHYNCRFAIINGETRDWVCTPAS